MSTPLRFFLCVGLVLGPVLLSVCQAADYAFYYLITYGAGVSMRGVFEQQVGFNGHFAFYAIGSLLGVVSAGLLAAWQQQHFAIVRSLVAFGLPVSLMASVVTVFDWDFLSGMGYVGAPATPRLWASRVALNATVQWSVVFLLASWSAMKQVGRG